MTDFDIRDSGILAELDSLIRPPSKEKTPAIPKFFAEFKGRSGSLVAEQQARSGSPIGARAIHQRLSSAVEDTEDNT